MVETSFKYCSGCHTWATICEVCGVDVEAWSFIETDEEAKGVGANVFRCLLDDVSLMCPVRESRELKDYFDTSMTDSILQRSDTNIRAVMINLKIIDKEIILRRCAEKAPIVVDIEKSVGWTKLWDAAVELGAKHTVPIRSKV